MTYKILAVHNKYLIGGGEDQSFAAEVNLLKKKGHEIYEYLEDNSKIKSLGKLRTAFRTIWSVEAYRQIIDIYATFPFDLVYVQNFFPLVSPSIYYAARRLNVPVIQFLRNYRLLCANGYFFRDGKVCELCLGKYFPVYGIKYGCYRDSRMGSITLAAMVGIHRLLNTWSDKVDLYITLTKFAKDKFVEGGLPDHKIIVKPNFISTDPGIGQHRGNYALYIGRLSPEKGIHTLINAFQMLPQDIHLQIAGDGPLIEFVKQKIKVNKNIEYIGSIPNQQVVEKMQDATLLVFPSEWYEGMPRTIIEAFAVGLAVVSSDLGAMSSMISHQKNGLLFKPGNASDLAQQVQWIFNHAKVREKMSRNARAEFEAKYTAERNYEMVDQILRDVIGRKAKLSENAKAY